MILLTLQMLHPFHFPFNSILIFQKEELPRRGALQGFASGAEGDERGDNWEDEPRHQESPPMQLRGEVQGHHPHLKQGHQLYDRIIELLVIRIRL